MTAGPAAGAELTHSHSVSDLQECTRLPLVIRERDVEYQVRSQVSVGCISDMLFRALQQ